MLRDEKLFGAWENSSGNSLTIIHLANHSQIDQFYRNHMIHMKGFFQEIKNKCVNLIDNSIFP